MRSAASWEQMAHRVQPIARNAPAALWEPITTQYASILIVGLSRLTQHPVDENLVRPLILPRTSWYSTRSQRYA